MIFRRQLIDAIGHLDEGLYTHFDNVVHFLDARRAMWVIWFVPDGALTHMVAVLTGILGTKPKRLLVYRFRARRRFFLKDYAPHCAQLSPTLRICADSLFGAPAVSFSASRILTRRQCCPIRCATLYS